MFRTSVKVVSISLNIWKVWPEVISFPHNCDGRRQQEECVGVEFGRKAGDVSALLSLAGRRRKKKEKLKWKIQSLVWQVRCWWQRCKSQLQCFHKDLSSCFHFFYLFFFFKEPAWSVGWRQQSTCQGFLKWHLSKKYFLQIPLILDCLNREKKKTYFSKTWIQRSDSNLLCGFPCFDHKNGSANENNGWRRTRQLTFWT